MQCILHGLERVLDGRELIPHLVGEQLNILKGTAMARGVRGGVVGVDFVSGI